jgi:hypothetical protein
VRQLARAGAVARAGLIRRAMHLRHEPDRGRMSAAPCAAQVAEREPASDIALAVPLTHGWSSDLQTRFPVHRRGRWTFLHIAGVPPTTTASERRLRPSGVHRKVTGGFRSEAFAHGYAALRTVADTARKRGADGFALLVASAGPCLPLTNRLAPAYP